MRSLSIVLFVFLALQACGLRNMNRNAGGSAWPVRKVDGLRLTLLGTGNPLVSEHRRGPATLLQSGETALLVDCGRGCVNGLGDADVSPAHVTAVLLTHFHSDHISDVADLAVMGWVYGRSGPLTVYGPPGTAKVVAGFNAAYGPDTDYRIKHHGNHLPAGGGFTAVELPYGAPVTVGAFVVRMFAVDHAPVEPAVGYRLEAAGRSVAVSGDTKFSMSLVEAAKGVDVLVHEAMREDWIREGAKRNPERSGLILDVVTYHTPVTEAARAARLAGAKALVLTHLVPGLPHGFFYDRAFKRGAADEFDGPITVGYDGYAVDLDPR